jgi:hypothetical protein
MKKSEAISVLANEKAKMTVGDNWRDVVDPVFYVDAGWPESWIWNLVRSHSAGGKTILGVWHPDFLEALCGVLGVNPAEYASAKGVAEKSRKMAIAIWLLCDEKEKEHEKRKNN